VYKFSRVLAAFAILLFVGKVAIFIAVYNITKTVAAPVIGTVLERYVEPETLPAWQIASAINAVLTWWIFFYSQRYLLEPDWSGRVVSVDNFYRITFTVRNVLSVYTSLCLLYITASISGHIRFPIRIIFLPF
jgi:hypothetical protein